MSDGAFTYASHVQCGDCTTRTWLYTPRGDRYEVTCRGCGKFIGHAPRELAEDARRNADEQKRASLYGADAPPRPTG